MRAGKLCAVAITLTVAAWAKDGGFAAPWLEASNALVGKERFREADLKSFLQHIESFLDRDSFHAGFREDGTFSYDLVLKDEAFLAWAKERHLDPKPWLRTTVRIWMLVIKRDWEDAVARDETFIGGQRKRLEDERARLSAEEYEQKKRALEELAALTRRLADAIKAVPAKSDEESALWKKYAGELNRILGIEEEKGPGEEEEGK